jgi:hypothetical protein
MEPNETELKSATQTKSPIPHQNGKTGHLFFKNVSDFTILISFQFFAFNPRLQKCPMPHENEKMGHFENERSRGKTQEFLF